MVAISALIAVFLAFLVVIEASPTLKRSQAARINGEEGREITATYDHRPLHTRDDQSLCQQITIDQLNEMTDALNDAKAIATANWGSDWHTINVNPPAYLDSPAQWCYPDPMQFTATWNSNPTCQSSTTKFSGYIKKGSNAAQVQIYQGSSVSASTTVESSTTLGSSTAFTAGVTVGIPGNEFSYSVTETVSVDLTNTKGSTKQSSNDARTTVQDTVTCDGPANVEIDVEIQTCTAAGNVNIPVTLGGWVWFYYGSRRSGHYDWAVNLDSGISPIAHRQQNISLSVNANTNTYGKFYGNCAHG